MESLDKLPSGNLPVVRTEINGTPYHVTRLGWWGVQDVIELLNSVLGPSLQSILDNEGASVSELMDMDASRVVAALLGGLSRAVGEDGRKLQLILASQTMIETEGRKVFLDERTSAVWFSQHPRDVPAWIRFAVEVQVRDFFEELIGAFGMRIDSGSLGSAMAAARAPKSQTT